MLFFEKGESQEEFSSTGTVCRLIGSSLLSMTTKLTDTNVEGIYQGNTLIQIRRVSFETALDFVLPHLEVDLGFAHF